MDEREVMEQEVGQEAYDIGFADGLKESNKSRDEEIKKLEYKIEGLESVAKANVEIMREYKRMARIRNEEIKKLNKELNIYDETNVSLVAKLNTSKAENKKLRDACILADKALRNMNLIERVKAEEAIQEALKESAK